MDGVGIYLRAKYFDSRAFYMISQLISMTVRVCVIITIYMKTEAQRGLLKVKLSQIKTFFRDTLLGRMSQEQTGPRGPQKGLGNGVGQGRLSLDCYHPQEAVESMGSYDFGLKATPNLILIIQMEPPISHISGLPKIALVKNLPANMGSSRDVS